MIGELNGLIQFLLIHSFYLSHGRWIVVGRGMETVKRNEFNKCYEVKLKADSNTCLIMENLTEFQPLSLLSIDGTMWIRTKWEIVL